MALPPGTLNRIFSPDTKPPLPAKTFEPPPLPMNPDDPPQRFVRDAVTYSAQDTQPWDGTIIRAPRLPIMDGMPTFVTLLRGQQGTCTKHTQTHVVLQRPKLDCEVQTDINLVEDIPFVAKLMLDMEALRAKIVMVQQELADSRAANEALQATIALLEEQEESVETSSDSEEDVRDVDAERAELNEERERLEALRAELDALRQEIDLDRRALERDRARVEADRTAVQSHDSRLGDIVDDQAQEIAALQESLSKATSQLYSLQASNKKLKEQNARLKVQAAFAATQRSHSASETIETRSTTESVELSLDDVVLPTTVDAGVQAEVEAGGRMWVSTSADIQRILMALAQYATVMKEGGYAAYKPVAEALLAVHPSMLGLQQRRKQPVRNMSFDKTPEPWGDETDTTEYGLTPSVVDKTAGSSAGVVSPNQLNNTPGGRGTGAGRQQRSGSCVGSPPHEKPRRGSGAVGAAPLQPPALAFKYIDDDHAKACSELTVGIIYDTLVTRVGTGDATAADYSGLEFPQSPVGKCASRASSPRDVSAATIPTGIVISPSSRSPTKAVDPFRRRKERSGLTQIYRPCRSIVPDPHLVTKDRDGTKYTIELVNYHPHVWPDEGGLQYEAKTNACDVPGRPACPRQDVRTPLSTKYPQRVQLQCKMASVYCLD